MSKIETREELAKLTVDQLRGKAKEKAIKGAWNMTKDQLLFELTKDQPKAAPKVAAKPVVKAKPAPKAQKTKEPKAPRKPQNRRPQELKWVGDKVDLTKLSLTPQALAIIDIVKAAAVVLRSDLIAKMPAKFAEAQCTTKQDPKHVLAYYLPTLKREGLVTLNYAKTEGAV